MGEWRKSVTDVHLHMCLWCGGCPGMLQYNAKSKEYTFIIYYIAAVCLSAACHKTLLCLHASVYF